MNLSQVNNFLTSCLKVFKYFLFSVFLSVCCIVILDLLIKSGFIEHLNDPIMDILSQESGKQSIFFYFVVIGPMVEEFAFRFYLIYKPKYVSISFALIVAYFSLSIISYFPSLIENKFILVASLTGLSLISFYVAFYLIRNDEVNKQSVRKFWEQHPIGIFYSSIILFGLIHLPNYEGLTFGQIIYTPLIIGPQMICGYFLAKLRIDQGIIWSILLHILINGFSSMKYLIY